MNLLLQYALELAMIVPATILSFLPVLKHLRRNKSVIFLFTAAISLSLILAGAVICYKTGMVSDYFIYPALVLFFIIYCLLVDLDFVKKLFCFLNALAFCEFCLFYTVFLMAPYEDKGPDTPLLPVSGLLCLGLTAVIIIFFFKILTTELSGLLNEQHLDNIWKYLTLMPCIVCLLINWFYPREASSIMEGRIRDVGLVLAPLIPLMFLVFYQVIWLVSRQTAENEALHQEVHILRQEKKRYLALRGYMNKSRALRHDFRQHLRVLEKLSRDGETERLSAYIHELIDASDIYDERYCANSAVDAIAAYYTSLGEKYEVDISWDLQLPEELPVQESDFCALFGNLMENALIAVRKLPSGRYVNVSARMLSEEMLGLNVENPYTGKIHYGKNALPRSRKKNGGIGLSSVSSTVQKYNGTINISTESDIFEIGVLLYARDKSPAD